MARRAAVLLVLLAVPFAPVADAATDAAIRALRSDGSLKVRTQAALVLGQRGAIEAVPALRDAVARDEAAAVRLAAITALGRLGDRSARPTLRAAAQADPDAAVRSAAEKALGALGPPAFTLEEPRGAGSAEARAALRRGIARQLEEHGFAVVAKGGVRLKPSVLAVDVDTRGGKTVIAVRAALVAVDGDGKVAAMLEGSARLSAGGVIPDAKVGAYSARALEAAAKGLCDDLAAKLGER